jgi:hypothetical protein
MSPFVIQNQVDMNPSVDPGVQFTVGRIANPSYEHSILGMFRPAGHLKWETRSRRGLGDGLGL